MRCCFLALAVCLLPGISGVASAQRVIIIPEHGSADKVVVLSDLPPDVRAALRQQLQCEPKAAFLYERFYVFGDAFDLWTWNGRFVLYDNGRYWDSSRDQLAQMLGPDGASKLSTPWGYWVPPGLGTILGIIAVVAVVVRFSAQARARKLLADSRYHQAMEVYAKTLPADREPNREEKQQALSAGIEFLERDHGVAADKAEARLRLIVAEMERDRSHALRQQAVEHEQEGQWDQAIDYYRQAAALRVDSDPKDHQFLLTCIERVLAKQARAGGG